ncbi:exo-alpha-sialidase [Jiangella anatolica]|uniref:Sialidase domain-containing protein n=1 Tax=Jiangella anatolica TaxID=2670374 RepID=A0A2W2BKZ3_9ACTN|nr:exo-alpha-sialidase [Jiangella anatolica]PZF86682.1 hypothetical protein C1I92_00465 [Jiangella anatolica]
MARHKELGKRAAVAAIAAGSLAVLLTGAPAHGVSDPALEVVDAWDVTSAATFPDKPAAIDAYRPALTEAPNGDLLIAFNTGTDGNEGDLRLIRSTDDGATWSPSTILDGTSSHEGGGGISSTRGMATLSNGTILLPYNDAINVQAYNDRKATLIVARSTDNGATWTGLNTPVTLPTPIREAWVGGTPIVELDNGTLLLPIWGAKELTPDWETDPRRWQSGVLRSFDGGLTWSDYRTIAYDPNNPVQFAPYSSVPYPSGANELFVQELSDGRLLAVIRYATGVGQNKGQAYLSYSSDNGATWSAPVASGRPAEALAMTTAPCTDALTGTQEKLVMGHRQLDSAGNRTGRAVLVSTFDGGVTWEGQTFLEDTSGTQLMGAATGEPAFHRLSANRLLVVFQAKIGTAKWKLVANVVEDATLATDCQDEAAAAASRVAATPTFFVERTDRNSWLWPYAVRKASHPTSTLVSAVIAAEAQGVLCAPGSGLQLTTRANPSTPLNPAHTLAQAGVTNGDVLRISSTTAPSGPVRAGINELDVFPQTRPGANWDQACAPSSLALDYRSRSLVLDVDIPAGGDVEAVELRNRTGTTRLNQSHYTILSSPDNDVYTEVTGWTFATRVESGRVIHRFAGLDITDPYVKIHQPFTDTAYTFVLDNYRNDVTVEFGS